MNKEKLRPIVKIIATALALIINPFALICYGVMWSYGATEDKDFGDYVLAYVMSYLVGVMMFVIALAFIDMFG